MKKRASEGVAAGVAVPHTDAVVAFFVGGQTAVDGVVEGNAQGVAIDVLGNVGGAVVVAAAREDVLDEAFAFGLAHGIGLGWVSILDPEQLTRDLDVPSHWRLIGYFCIGYPLTEEESPELERLGWEKRQDLPALLER